MKLSLSTQSILATALMLALMTAALSVYAQETEETSTTSATTSAATSSSPQDNRPVSVTERIERLEEARAERQIERRGVLQDRAQTRIINLAANTSNRHEAAIRRLENVANRLDSRITKLQAQGLDTSAGVAALAVARTELSRARTLLATIDADVVTFVSSENPQTNWGRVKNIYTDSRDAIKAAHSALQTSLIALQQVSSQPTPTEPAATEDNVTE